MRDEPRHSVVPSSCDLRRDSRARMPGTWSGLRSSWKGVVHLDGRSPAARADAFHLFEREDAVRGDAFVPDAELFLEALIHIVGAAQHATDVGADLHVEFARRLEAQHRVVGSHVAHIEFGDADALRLLLRSPRRTDSRSRPAHRAASEPAPSASPDTSSPARRSGPPAAAKRWSSFRCSLHQLPRPRLGRHIHLFLTCRS